MELLIKCLSSLILTSSSQAASTPCGFSSHRCFSSSPLVVTHLLFPSCSQFYFHPTSFILSFVLALETHLLSLGSDLDSASDFCFSIAIAALTSWKGVTPATLPELQLPVPGEQRTLCPTCDEVRGSTDWEVRESCSGTRLLTILLASHSSWVASLPPGSFPRGVSFQLEEKLGHMYNLDLSLPQLQTAKSMEEYTRTCEPAFTQWHENPVNSLGFSSPLLSLFFEVKSFCCQPWWGLACLTEVVIWQDVSSLSFKWWNTALSISYGRLVLAATSISSLWNFAFPWRYASLKMKKKKTIILGVKRACA